MATTSGTLVNDVKSPYSGPYVHYSATYFSARADASSQAVTVTLNFKAWLQSSLSTLGTGIILIIYARISGGKWKSVVIKQSNDSWNGTAKHSADALTLSGSSSGNKISVEFYVARGDSRGNAGRLGSSSSPKKYTASLPAYQSGGSGGDSPSGTVARGYIHTGGVWKPAPEFINPDGTWKKAEAYVYAGGVWKKGVN